MQGVVAGMEDERGGRRTGMWWCARGRKEEGKRACSIAQHLRGGKKRRAYLCLSEPGKGRDEEG